MEDVSQVIKGRSNYRDDHNRRQFTYEKVMTSTESLLVRLLL
jgi:hypothetical protein